MLLFCGGITTGLKNYKFLVGAFLFSYLFIFVLAIYFYTYKLTALLLIFYTGHVILLLAFFSYVLINYPVRKLFSRSIIDFMKNHKYLLLSGVFLQIGIWIDKIIFWIYPSTSIAILDNLRASPIYDMPMFLAFIFMIPGMSAFFYQVEGNFARYYSYYFDAIRNGATLNEISDKCISLVTMARGSFLTIIKIQIIVGLFAILFAPEILNLLGLAPIYIYLFRIDIVSISLLVFFIGQVNILYYLDQSKPVFYISSVFLVLNIFCTVFSIYLGPLFYGYGFAAALLVGNFMAALLLIKAFKEITFNSFMSI